MNQNTTRVDSSHGNGRIDKATEPACYNWRSKQDVNLRKNGFLHFQIGLIIALALVYGGFEATFEFFKDVEPMNQIEEISETEYFLDFSKIEVEKEIVKEVKPLKKKLVQKFTEVKDDFKIEEGKEEFVQEPKEPVVSNAGLGGPPTKEKPKEVRELPMGAITEVPVFPGCERVSKEERLACFQKKMKKHIKRNFRYPNSAIATRQEGRVSVLFKIDEFGKVSDIRMKGPAEVLEEEAERIISKLPQMTPGKVNGRPVRVVYTIPIHFQLN
ncbi:energy transducer TonB [Flagellimonas sp. 2504JD4-2]